MSDPSSYAQVVLSQLKAQAPEMRVNPSIPLKKYYASAADLHTQAQQYLAEHDDERAFVFLLRFAQIVILTIAKHPGVKGITFAKQKKEYRALAEEALGQCEVIKKRLLEKYSQAPSEEEEEEKVEPVVATTPSAPPVDTNSDSADAAQTLPAAVNDLHVSRQPSWHHLRLNFDAGPVEKKQLPPSVLPIAPAYPTIIKSPVSAPPTVPASASTSTPPAQAKPPQSSGSKAVKKILKLRTVCLPGSLMSQFLDYVRDNTMKDIETCGILTGVLKDNQLVITTIVIPKQEATANTCVTHSEEDLFELQDKKGLLTLGWIHTHPTQTCFLSSIDLHTHFSYQIMLDEAIAIVMAPTARPNSGVFSLTSKGIQILGVSRIRLTPSYAPFFLAVV